MQIFQKLSDKIQKVWLGLIALPHRLWEIHEVFNTIDFLSTKADSAVE